MNTSLIALGVASLAVVGFLVTLGILSLLTGAFYFLFGKKKYEILKSQNGPTGFAFGLSWNQAREPAKFDRVQIRLYNPFGNPTQMEVTKDFEPKSDDFAVDLDLGPAYEKLLGAKDFDKGRVTLTVYSTKDSVSFPFEMKATDFKSQLEDASQTVEEYLGEKAPQKSKPVFQTVSRSFIAEPLPETEKKVLKIASNPMFAGQLPQGGGGAAQQEEQRENFPVQKVWIEPGCIVCNACEDIYPEVFDVTDETCIIRPDAPLTDGLRIEEAAEACPVEVIKFTKAS